MFIVLSIYNFGKEKKRFDGDVSWTQNLMKENFSTTDFERKNRELHVHILCCLSFVECWSVFLLFQFEDSYLLLSFALRHLAVIQSNSDESHLRFERWFGLYSHHLILKPKSYLTVLHVWLNFDGDTGSNIGFQIIARGQRFWRKEFKTLF